jgi:hypothetical protein
MSSDEWRKWPKISPARSGAANTKRYKWIRFYGDGTLPRLFGEPASGEVCLARLRYNDRGPLAGRCLRERCEDFAPRTTMDPCVAHVAAEPFELGIRYIHQRYVRGAQTGTPRLYGERWP